MLTSMPRTLNDQPRRRGPVKRLPELAEVRRVSVVDELVEQMTRKIIAGAWPPGTALPSLREFAADTGVSTLSVREAIRTLQARGWVEARHGIGTFVLDQNEDVRFSPWALGASDTDEFVELVEAREAIESAIIKLAAERRTNEQLTTLEGLLDDMRAAGSDCDRFLAADAEFHIMLAEAAHNRILLRSMLAIRSPMRRLMATRLAQEVKEQGSLKRSVREHATIVEAVRDRNADSACSALTAIVERSRRHLTASSKENHDTSGT